MSCRENASVAVGAVLATAFGLHGCTPLSAQTKDPLAFCLAEDNLPFSAATPPQGIDVELATAIGERLGREVEFIWQGPEEPTPEAALRKGHCDIAMGAIADVGSMAQSNRVPGLKLTLPYYSAGYVLIHRPDVSSPRTLAGVGDSRIAIEMVSIPIYTLKQRGYKVYALDDYDAVINAVADGRAEYGYVWGPLAAWLLRDATAVVLAGEFEPAERWEFAMAVREDHSSTLKALNSTIEELVQSGALSRIFSAYHVPYMLASAGAE